MKNAVGLTPLAVILAILIGGALLGPLGALLAIPVAAAVQVLVVDLLREREDADDAPEPAVAVSVAGCGSNRQQWSRRSSDRPGASRSESGQRRAVARRSPIRPGAVQPPRRAGDASSLRRVALLGGRPRQPCGEPDRRGGRAQRGTKWLIARTPDRRGTLV